MAQSRGQDPIVDAFRMFDTDGDGFLSPAEAASVIRCLGHVITDAEMMQLFRRAGSDGRHPVDVGTVRRMVEPLQGNNYVREVREAFSALDKDNSGYLSAAELRQLLTKMGEKLSDDEFNVLLEEMSVDENGRVRSDDFIYLLTSK